MKGSEGRRNSLLAQHLDEGVHAAQRQRAVEGKLPRFRRRERDRLLRRGGAFAFGRFGLGAGQQFQALAAAEIHNSRRRDHDVHRERRDREQ